jgi:hypothetical protein
MSRIFEDATEPSVFSLNPAPSVLTFGFDMGYPFENFTERYSIDNNGHRVLLGLSIEDIWQDDVPITSREKRWLELYQKHDEAWKAAERGGVPN